MSLYILPFDHRGSFQKMFFGDGPIGLEEKQTLRSYKEVIWDAFKAVAERRGKENLAILVDAEYGADIQKEAEKMGVQRALTVERSGKDVFEFEHIDFGAHIDAVHPTHAKALIRVVMGEDHAVQNMRLKELQDFTRQHGYKFLLEPLIFPSAEDLAACDGDKKKFDATLRTERFVEAVGELHAAGIYPDVWKIEGTETREDMQRCADSAKSGTDVPVDIIILGRGEGGDKVEHWLREAAAVFDVTGFAVGRTIFSGPLKQLHAGEIDREDAVDDIAGAFEHFIAVFESGRAA